MKHKVLLVDDDARFLDAYKRDLKDEFNIVTALGNAQGLAEINDQGPYALVVSDLNLPGMNGVVGHAGSKKMARGRPVSVGRAIHELPDLRGRKNPRRRLPIRAFQPGA